jgi:hypothetical protein
MATPTFCIPTANMTLPVEGPQAIPVNLDLSVDINQEIDVTQLTGNGQISFVSGMWADNLDNAHDVTMICNGSNQRILIPASSQGWYVLLATNPPVFNVSQAATGAELRLIFVNFPVFPFVRS